MSGCPLRWFHCYKHVIGRHGRNLSGRITGKNTPQQTRCSHCLAACQNLHKTLPDEHRLYFLSNQNVRWLSGKEAQDDEGQGHYSLTEEFIRRDSKARGQLEKYNTGSLQSERSSSAADVEDAEAEEDWADQFGSLSSTDQTEQTESVDDDGDESDDEPYRSAVAMRRGRTADSYGKHIEQLSKQGKIKECIDLIEKMLNEDRVLPNQYVFTVLIGALGRVGYTKMAFKYFNKMKKYGLQPQDPTYTALFNACSNSPWKADGLQRANKLRELIGEKGYTPNLITYKAMIKAYGVLGEMDTAFAIMDEVVESEYRLDAEAYVMLLMACCSNKEAGLKLAVEVWRNMRKRRIKPSLYCYNNLLRAIRDCGLGDQEFANQLLKSEGNVAEKDNMDGSSQQPADIKPPLLTLNAMQKNLHEAEDTNFKLGDNMQTDSPQYHSDRSEENVHENNQNSLTSREWWQKPLTPTVPTYGHQMALSAVASDMRSLSICQMAVPNILNPRGVFQTAMSLGDLSTPSARLRLFGGLPGILSHMLKDKVEPNNITFALLLHSVEPQEENELVVAMANHRVKPTVDFCNQLIQKRNKRRDYQGVQDVLSYMATMSLIPDLRTYGHCALGCNNKRQASKLLNEMEEAGLTPNILVYIAFLKHSPVDFPYKQFLLRHMKKTGVLPNETFINFLETYVERARRIIVDKERGKLVDRRYEGEEFNQEFTKFMKYYKGWLLETKIELPAHPWAQFRTPAQPDEQQQEQAA